MCHENKKKIIGESINIGSNFEISIKDILQILNNDFGYKFTIKIDKIRIRPKNSEVYRLFASNKKAKKLLDWKPKYNGREGFKKALKLTIEWYKKNKEFRYTSSKYNI